MNCHLIENVADYAKRR